LRRRLLRLRLRLGLRRRLPAARRPVLLLLRLLRLLRRALGRLLRFARGLLGLRLRFARGALLLLL